MITPEFLSEVVRSTEKAVSVLNQNLIKRISERVSAAFNKKQNLIMPSTISEMMRIAQSGYSVDEVQSMIENALPSIQNEVKDAFYISANEISKYNAEFTKQLVGYAKLDVEVPDYTVDGIPKSAKELNMTTREIRVLENAYKRTNGSIKNLTRTTASSAYQQYIDACDNAFMKAQSGMSLSEAISEACDELASQGIKCIDFSGRTDTIETAVARAVRTGVNQANSEIILTRCAELGVSYVKVSQHLGARVTKHSDYTNHSWWQGKVYKLDWSKGVLKQYKVESPLYEPKYSFFGRIRKALGRDDYNYPDFVETCGYGQIEGIIGINCRHTFQAWYPGINKNTEKPIDQKENDKRYKNEQSQRAMERAMRKTRRRIEAQKSIEQTEAVKEKLANLKALLKKQGEKYADFCKENNLQPDYQRTRIGVDKNV